VILGHHYQRDEVIKFADYTGDSFKLAGEIARHPDAEFIVFCGVHLMAESADVLSAATGFSSYRTSTSAATPRTSSACRSMRCSSGIRTRFGADTSPTR